MGLDSFHNMQAVCDTRSVAGPGKRGSFKLYQYEYVVVLYVSNIFYLYLFMSHYFTGKETRYHGLPRNPTVSSCRSAFSRVYVLGDPAYIPTEHMITPYSGVHGEDEWNSIFNFYLSQLRIRVEMAFGRLTTKWKFLRKPLDVKLENAAKVVESCAKLQNFCITNDSIDIFVDDVEICIIDELPTMDEEGHGYLPV